MPHLLRSICVSLLLLLVASCGRSSVSIDIICGDGEIDRGEECDDGNNEPFDGCSQLCQIEPPPACGDGNLNPGEQCDDGNLVSGDGCDDTCRREIMPDCGDGAIDAGEECDDGNNLAGDGCNPFCQVEGARVCGNGAIEPGEECDDGNTDPFDGCDQFCLVESVCGNFITEPGEQCDDGNLINGDGCDTFCRVEPPALCGNLRLDPGEECDDGNQRPGDGCSEFCLLEAMAFCGNRVLDVGEECDDGNVFPGDGCDQFCRVEAPATCGNRRLDRGEECDDGNLRPGDGCDERCRIEAPETCGNGELDLGEECDDGNTRPGDGCDDRCRVERRPVCGNAVIEFGEQCDDGNTRPGDGCDEFCRREPPARCGNGFLDPGEECDDGNVMSGDGCSEFCEDEMMPMCGNGRIEIGEECDDGNLIPGDGCDDLCRIEIPPVCGDGRMDPGEECDDGNTVPRDGCDEFCRIETCTPDVVLGTLPTNVTVTRSVDVTAETDDVAGCGMGSDLVIAFSTGVDADVRLETLQLGDHTFGLYRRPSGFNCTEDLERCFDPGGAPSAMTLFGMLEAGDYLLVVEEVTPGSGGPASVALTVIGETPNCGDGDIDPGEVCDDSNTVSGDGCSADCLSLEICGNGFLDAAVGEVCDDGNLTSGDGCSADCMSEEVCGNGTIDDGEICDDGNRRSGDGCSRDCRSNETCGNGIVDGPVGEQCDDGGTVPGDGCDGMCQFEIGECIVDEALGTLAPGVPASRFLNIATAGDQWNTDCSPMGPERVLSFSVTRTSDIRMRFDQMGHHNVGLYSEGEVTDRCVARSGVCGSTGPDEGLGIIFRGRPPGNYFFVVEANSPMSAGTANVSLLVEGCAPSSDLGIIRRGTTRTAMANTVGAENTFRAGCSGPVSGNEQVVAFEVTEEVLMTLAWNQTGDHVFGLFRERGGRCDEFGVACHDPVGAAIGTTTFPRLSPGTYVLIVDAHDPGDEGMIGLTLTTR